MRLISISIILMALLALTPFIMDSYAQQTPIAAEPSASSEPGSNFGTPPPPPEMTLLQSVLKVITDNLEALKWIAGLLATGMSIFALKSHSLIRNLLRGLKIPLLPRVKETTVSRILLLGIGNVGKTSLIQKLTRNPDANPKKKTRKVQTYQFIFANVADDVVKNNNYVINDYRGYSPAELAKVYMTDHSKEIVANSPGVIIILADIIDTPDANEDEPLVTNLNDNQIRDRIAAHVNHWSIDLLQTMAVSARCERPSKIILFINKIDTLKKIDFASIKTIESGFLPLVKNIEKAFAASIKEEETNLVVLCGSLGGDFSKKTFLDDINFAKLVAELQ